MDYVYTPHNETENGLTLLQVHPTLAVDLNVKSPNYGWLFMQNEKHQEWEKHSKLTSDELQRAWDQSSDLMVLDVTAEPPPPPKRRRFFG